MEGEFLSDLSFNSGFDLMEAVCRVLCSQAPANV